MNSKETELYEHEQYNKQHQFGHIHSRIPNEISGSEAYSVHKSSLHNNGVLTYNLSYFTKRLGLDQETSLSLTQEYQMRSVAPAREYWSAV
jgi:hypothetical protein